MISFHQYLQIRLCEDEELRKVNPVLVEESDVLLEVQAEEDGLQLRVAPHLPLSLPLLQAGLQIRIDLKRIRIQHFL
jgi:hypothetical protein